MNQTRSADHSFIYPLYRDMIRNKINYGYRGVFSREVSDGLIEFANGIFDQSDLSRKLRKRVVYILVECVQNVSRHQELPEEVPSERNGIFLIQSDQEMFNISQGNMIRNNKLPKLKERLEHINSLSADELKDKYRSILQGTGMTEKGGAGLGLIEIARKSGHKIRYKFQPVNDDFSFFFMDTLISDPDAHDPSIGQSFYGMDITGKLMSLLGKHHINLIYCSQFSGQHAFDLLSIIENLKLDEEKTFLVKKRLFIILVELLQNIYHHAAIHTGTHGKTGILLLGTDGDNNHIITGNMIRTEELGSLTDHIDFLNSLDYSGLEAFYKERLSDDDFSDPHKNGLGMVDMVMKSGHPIQFDSATVDEQYSFVTIQVTVAN